MISEADSDKLVFLDESGVNTDMTRHYGRAVGKERVVDNAPENTPINTTILSSIRLNGETAFTTYSGGTTGENVAQVQQPNPREWPHRMKRSIYDCNRALSFSSRGLQALKASSQPIPSAGIIWAETLW